MKVAIPFIRDLRQIVENNGWTFYQIPLIAPSWEEIERRKPAENVEVGHHCIFAPIPRNGQTLREAYSVTNGLGPSLIIDPCWMGIEETYRGSFSIGRENEILFSRIWFANERSTVLISPKTRDNPDPSAVSIKMNDTIETFRRYFRVVSPEDYGLPTPVPKPFHPEYN